jgi:two-component system sensor histidine kinase and response regulator WspE
MQPFSDGIKGLPRLVRDLSHRQNKQIRLEVAGEDTQIDRDIMEKLEAPLTHIVTNAIDHGVESPAVREKAGKPQEATIKIEAKHLSGQLYITISDDGGGVNFEALRQKIITNNLVSEKIANDLKESELLEFLFLPNFSTRSTLSESSGRGVGLDVVHNIIRQVRGSIEVSSEPGHGSYFELRLPLALSIIRSIVAEINNEPYAFPLVSIDHVVNLDREEIKEMEGRQYIISQNKRIGIIPARQVLDLDDREADEDKLSIIVLENSNTPYGLIVDRLDGIRDLVVQPLTSKLGKLRSINAASIAEDGTPILILDVQDLIMTMDHLISGNRLQHIDINAPHQSLQQNKRILVVDDSITVREVERSLLTKHGFEVDVAADGIAAWNLIKQGNFSLIITDVDMPQMDGIELLCQLRESQDFEELPVIIVSYKDREEDKNRGLEAGADYYLTKGSFTDRSLIEAVEDLIGYPEKMP